MEGASNEVARDGRDADRGEPHVLDAIINGGTLTIGWVGPALLGILIAAFGWAGRVFEWLETLATWLFSGEWFSPAAADRFCAICRLSHALIWEYNIPQWLALCYTIGETQEEQIDRSRTSNTGN